MVTKFVDSYSHDVSSPNIVYHFYSHQRHRLMINRSIMTNMVDVGMLPSNIFRVINAMNHREGCEEVSP